MNKTLLAVVGFSWGVSLLLIFYPDIFQVRDKWDVDSSVSYMVLLFLFLTASGIFILFGSLYKRRLWFSPEKRLSTIILLMIFLAIYVFIYFVWKRGGVGIF